MALGPERLLNLVKTKKLVLGLSKRELMNPEGAGFDLRLKEVHEINYLSEAFIGRVDRKTPETKVIAKFNKRKKSIITVNPGKYFLVKTIEKVNLPEDLTGRIFTRTSLFRAGLMLICSQVAPGYRGELIFGLYNAGPIPVPIEMGAQIAHIQFDQVEGGGTLYRGQNQDGRVTSQGRSEKQV